MKLELNRFIKAAAAGDQSKYKSRRDTLIDDFCNLLGFKRWHTPSIRPDCDPKWDAFKWSARDRGYVDDVRVMSFTNMYANAAITVANRNDSTYPNDWKVAEVIQTLMQLCREYKAGMRRSLLDVRYYNSNDNNYEYREWHTVAKYLLNITYSIFCRFGTRHIGFGAHDIVAEARNTTINAVNQILKSGGIVLAVFCDEIVYSGEQVDVPDVHHEKFKKLVFSKFDGYSYGNDIRTTHVGSLRLDMTGWEPIHSFRDDETQRSGIVAHIQKNKERIVQSIREYMALTKEDIDKKFVDLSGE